MDAEAHEGFNYVLNLQPARVPLAAFTVMFIEIASGNIEHYLESVWEQNTNNFHTKLCQF